MFGYYHNNNNYNINSHNSNNKIILMIMLYPHKYCIFQIFFEKKLKGMAPLASPAETSFSGMEDVQRSPRPIP